MIVLMKYLIIMNVFIDIGHADAFPGPRLGVRAEQLLMNVLIIYIYISLVYCLQTLRTEGPLALYKGFFPSYLRLGPWNIIVSFFHSCMF